MRGNCARASRRCFHSFRGSQFHWKSSLTWPVRIANKEHSAYVSLVAAAIAALESAAPTAAQAPVQRPLSARTQRLLCDRLNSELQRTALEKDDDTTDDEGRNAGAAEPLLSLSPLLRAAHGGRGPVVAQLVAAGGPDGDTKGASWRDRSAMHLALRCGPVETVEVLLDAGMAAVASDRDMFGDTSLQLAARAGHLRVVRLPHEQDGSTASQYNAYGDSPLHSAARNGHANVAAFLIESTPIEPCALRKDGVSPLALAGGVDDVVGRAVADALVLRAKLRGVASLSRSLVHVARLGLADVVSALLEGGEGGVSPSCDPDEKLALTHAARVGVDPSSVVRALLAHTVCTGPFMLRTDADAS